MGPQTILFPITISFPPELFDFLGGFSNSKLPKKKTSTLFRDISLYSNFPKRSPFQLGGWGWSHPFCSGLKATHSNLRRRSWLRGRRGGSRGGSRLSCGGCSLTRTRMGWLRPTNFGESEGVFFHIFRYCQIYPTTPKLDQHLTVGLQLDQ